MAKSKTKDQKRSKKRQAVAAEKAKRRKELVKKDRISRARARERYNASQRELKKFRNKKIGVKVG